MNKNSMKKLMSRVLLPYGYANVKDMFFRRKGEVFSLVGLDKSSFGGMFNLLLGAFVDEGMTLSQPPRMECSHIHMCLHWLTPGSEEMPLLVALDLEKSMSDANRAAAITNALTNYAIPFLDSCDTLEGIANLLGPDKETVPPSTVALREILKRRLDFDDSRFNKTKSGSRSN